ncbi:hypothetical protein [Pedobacter sp. UBA5917]|uniref:hypothetical protein n=1 Tax=Pedobacter sp. UBA5917 TaxID=1947061 RepID=UPI0025D29D3A|nr:hypothetical protein [Pedobacter sp. UBA5917]
MEKIINPTLLKRNMLVASLFVTSFEMLKTTIQGKIKDFLCMDGALNDQGEFEYEISDQYRSEILDRIIPHIDKKKARDYHLFYSSCLWLKENGVITKGDIGYLERIRKHRNLVAHEPLRLLIDENANINIDLLKKSQQLLNKIEKWWIMEFEIPVNPDFDGKEIDEKDVQSGTTIFLDYLMHVANDEVNNSKE